MNILRLAAPALVLALPLLAACGGKSAEKAVDNASQPPAPAVAAPTGDMSGMLRIAWTLQSQEDVMGFNVYRGEKPEGPWTKANAKPIPGDDTTMFEKRYDFFDTGLELGREYHYYVEEITYSGTTSKITDTMSSKAKPRQYYVDKGYNPPEL
jgi:hypothetical protein